MMGAGLALVMVMIMPVVVVVSVVVTRGRAERRETARFLPEQHKTDHANGCK